MPSRSPKKMFENLNHFTRKNYPITTYGNKSGIFAEEKHAYSLLEAEQTELESIKSKHFLKLFNPWNENV
jgi:hypothetical protein